MEVEINVNMSSENGTTISCIMDGKDMDMTDRKNRRNAFHAVIAAMSMLETACGVEREERTIDEDAEEAEPGSGDLNRCCGTCASFLLEYEDAWGSSWCGRIRDTVNCYAVCPAYMKREETI